MCISHIYIIYYLYHIYIWHSFSVVLATICRTMQLTKKYQWITKKCLIVFIYQSAVLDYLYDLTCDKWVKHQSQGRYICFAAWLDSGSQKLKKNQFLRHWNMQALNHRWRKKYMLDVISCSWVINSKYREYVIARSICVYKKPLSEKRCWIYQ